MCTKSERSWHCTRSSHPAKYLLPWRRISHPLVVPQGRSFSAKSLTASSSQEEGTQTCKLNKECLITSGFILSLSVSPLLVADGVTVNGRGLIVQHETD